MTNFAGLLRAPRIIWMVSLERKHSASEYQNSRKRRVYVRADDAETAFAEAEKQHPEFKAVSARRAPL